MKLLSGLLVASSLLITSHTTFAASDTAQALQVVESAIAITQQSDLDFGTAVQGDAASTVDADTVETASNASFLVTGEPNKAYNITLPLDGDVVMNTGTGSTAQEQISVNSYESFPVSTGTLDGTGQDNLFVGATRSALLPDQVAGSYSSNFTVTVIY